jgi:hypothetical protein
MCTLSLQIPIKLNLSDEFETFRIFTIPVIANKWKRYYKKEFGCVLNNLQRLKNIVVPLARREEIL